ncbi:hypothetical protein EJB05_14983, partial [Eragrostis curvula]
MSSSDEATSSAEGPSPPPCAGCKHLRRRCVPSCAFAAYFPPEHGDQFAAVHKVFGASNVSKLLAEVAPGDRAGAVESLVYEARARLRDPAFGCVSYITVLEHMLKQGMGDLAAARGQLAGHVGGAAAFRPFDAGRASPEARMAGSARLDEVLRFAKEQDDKMRAVRVAFEAKRKQGRAEAWKDAVNRQMAEAQQAAAAVQSAREQAMQIHQAAAVTGQGIPRQQMAEAPESVAAAKAATEQAMMAQHGTGLVFPDGRVHGHPRQQIADAQKAASWEQQEIKMREDELYYHPAVHYAAMGREHPNSLPRMAHAPQLAAEENIVWGQEMMLRQAAAAAAELTAENQNMLAMMQQDAAELGRDQNVMLLLQQAVGGHGHPDLHQETVVQQIANAQQLSAVAEVAREQDLMMTQQQAAAYAHAMPGSMSGAARNIAFQPGGSPDAEAFPGQQQPQPVSALGFQTGSSLPPSLADLPRQPENDNGGDFDDGQLSDLTAYFGIPGPNLPPNGSGSS